MRIRLFLLLSFMAVFRLLNAQVDTVSMSAPFDFPLLLSGNFGELRSNHFHAGIDFKTQGVTGKHIKAPADGYISRATVTPGGYGRAIYITHTDGYITVYGHLHRFLPQVAERVRSKQYADETFAVDLNFESGEFPVKRGETVAIAGNSGYSFGPHLHFEVRSSDGKSLINPMRFYKNSLKDTKVPVIHSVAITPYKGAGVVNGLPKRAVRRVRNTVSNDTVTAWGCVGFSVRANDYMDDTNNRYGVYSIELYVDDSLRFSSRMDEYLMRDTRQINGSVDFERHINNDEWYTLMYKLENNTLGFISADRNDGWLMVDEERLYNVECRLADYHGNEKRYRFFVKGVCDTIPPMEDDGSHYLYWFLNNEIAYEGMRVRIPHGELFEDAIINVTEQPSKFALSRCYDLGGAAYPLRSKVALSLQLCDTAKYAAEKYHIRRITKKGTHNVGGRYSNGWVTADISMLGCYEVAIDTVAPSVKAVNEKRWARNALLQFRAGDKGRGIRDFKGKIDGEFVLFEYSSKNGMLTCNLKNENVKRGKHKLLLTVTDNAGNVKTVERSFTY